MTEFRKHGKFPIAFAERNPIPPFFLLLYYIWLIFDLYFFRFGFVYEVNHLIMIKTKHK